nr:hypothetical protein [uncultured Acetatifactor sp.]
MTPISEERVFKIRRNLADAGCNAPFIEQFLALEQQQKRKEQYGLLSQYRSSLLHEIHREQYKIDCLDHMLYTMQKEDKERSKF